MARIPTYISEQPNAGPTGVVAGPTATSQQFGADVGAAQQALGAAEIETGSGRFGIGAIGAARSTEEFKKQNTLETVNHVAKFDFSKTFLDMQTAATDPKDFQQNIANKFDDTVDKYVNGLDVNNIVRTAVKEKLLAQRQGFMTAAANFETHTLDARDRTDSNIGLQTQNGLVMSDPSIETFRSAEQKSNDLIDAQPGIQQAIKDKMKFANSQELALNRFRGLENAAKGDPLALQGVKNELQGEEWAKKMKPDDRFAMLERLDHNIRSANTAEASAGRAAIQTIKQRNTDGVPIDPAEMAGVADAVNKSNRPELMSQFAMMQRRNEVFTTGRSLPLSEQRAGLEKALKAGGVANLPEPVKAGISQGAALTNGVIGQEYLAGLVNAEYGHKVGSGDYGAPTGNLNSKGQRGSDAIGIAQFTGNTFLQTVKAHADELGVAAGTSDADLLKLRADPVFSIKAAALHAADNKRILEGELGRPVTDGDLYFAHFLGTAGARRFLTAADANPKGIATQNVGADQVDANKNVFYQDGNVARPRTNEQVRAYMTQAMMNGPSRVDYSEAKAWQTVIQATQKGLKENPVGFAQSTGGHFADVGDVNTPEGMQRRGVVAQQIAEFYGVPSHDFKPFQPDEVEMLSKKARDGTADETLAVMKSVAGLGGNMAKAGFRQIGEKDTLFGYAAGLAYTGGDQGVAGDIIRGEKRMRDDKDIKTAIGQSDADMTASFQQIVGKSLLGTTIGTQVRQAAEAYYAEKYISRGGATVGRFDNSMFTEAVNAVLGGQGKPIVAKYNGAQMKLPQGLDVETFSTAVDRMGVADFGALSKWGGPPRYIDGSLARPSEIASEGKFEWIGGNEYRVKMADNTYLLSGMQNGRAAPYIFVGDPRTLAQYAARPKVQVPLATALPAALQP